jgi:hypothetical protein
MAFFLLELSFFQFLLESTSSGTFLLQLLLELSEDENESI